MSCNKLVGWFLVGIIITGLSTPLWAKPVQIVAITEDFASIAQSIGGELVDVVPLIEGSRNLHNINPKPSMVMKVRTADLLIRLGMEQDGWIDELIQVARNKKVFPGKIGYLDCSINIQKLQIPADNIDGSLGDVHKHGNPHYWLNPENGKIIAAQIRDHLKEIDAKNQSTYENNFVLFSDTIDEKMKQWKKQLQPLQEFQIVTFHKIWPYFFYGFQLESVGELEPLPGIPPTTKHLAQLKSKLESNSKPILVLSASFYPEVIGKSFAHDVGGTFKHLPINVGESGIRSYIDLFDFLEKELKQ